MSRLLNLISPFVAASALVAFIGCNPPSAPDVPAPTSDHDHAHAHSEHGPHEGELIELGNEEYHAELTHDDATKTVTIYLLDNEAMAPVAIADAEISLNLVVDGQPMQVKLAAAPQEGDAEGQSSRFSVTDEKVLEALEAEKTTGMLNVSIGGKEYSGKVEHHDHGK
jgi:hypothetical protein